MNEAQPFSEPQQLQDPEAEIVRLNKIIRALVNRAERAMSVQQSDFGLFETAILLEEEVRHRTKELEAALRENERINHALQRSQEQMQAEIRERKLAQKALTKANKRLEELSATDPLTGLANRRRFSEMFEGEWQHALCTDDPLALVMIDIDDFKKYNDRYGHQAGDRCLRLVTAALTEAVRGTDLVARYGGEEFVFVLPDTDLDDARQIAERARARVEALQEEHEGTDAGVVTISLGVSAMVPMRDNRPKELVAQADAALYSAKGAGKNRVVVHVQEKCVK